MKDKRLDALLENLNIGMSCKYYEYACEGLDICRKKVDAARAKGADENEAAYHYKTDCDGVILHCELEDNE